MAFRLVRGTAEHWPVPWKRGSAAWESLCTAGEGMVADDPT